MKFSEIVKKNSWSSIKSLFLQLYPDEKPNIDEYEKVFNKIKLLKPHKSDMLISITREMEDNKYYYDVSGYLPKKKRKNKLDDFISYGLQHTSWNEWLGMNIYDKSGYVCSEIEVICHCLWEMTYSSFDQNEIENISKIIGGRIEKIDKITENEKRKKDRIAREKNLN
ncbi:MAG TPA: hypothetical protein PKN32_07395 [Bacteroidales bacterium]|nr:hypothetical protein [Bacteroidales bacterium]